MEQCGGHISMGWNISLHCILRHILGIGQRHGWVIKCACLSFTLHTLSISTFLQSSYLLLLTDFITEAKEEEQEGGEGGADGSASGSLAAEGLGLGPEVPRCLRWPAAEMVPMRRLGLRDTEEAVAAIWEVGVEQGLLWGRISRMADRSIIFRTKLVFFSCVCT